MRRYVVLLIFAHELILLALPFTTWPEMLLYPWLTANGFAQYREIIHPYFPGLIWVLTLLGKLIGFTPIMIKLATYSIVVLSDALVYRAARLLVSRRNAISILLLYLVWQVGFEGNGLWFDLALTPLAICALYGLLRFLKESTFRWLLVTALALFLAALVKQTGVWFVLAGMGVLLARRGVKAALQVGALVMVGTGIFILIGAGVWGQEFLYWTLVFPLVDQKQIIGFLLLPTIRELGVVGLLLIPAAVGFYSTRQKEKLLILPFIAAGVLAALPRWGLFHLQPALPFLALLAGSSLPKIGKRFLLLVLVPALHIVLSAMRLGGDDDRFVTKEITMTARLLREEAGSSRVFILGAPQIIYVFSGYVPSKPWADLFPWYYQVRQAGLEARVLSSLEAAPPAFVLRSPISGDRPEYRYRPHTIEQWADENYQEYMVLPSGVLWKKQTAQPYLNFTSNRDE